MSKTRWTHDEVVAWFAGQLPDDWFVEAPAIEADRDEIMIRGRLPDPADAPEDESDRAVAEQSRITGFREDTRGARIAIAERAEAMWSRKVSWAATCGSTEATFTSASVPVMTRLRMSERRLLDTLIDAGVARSRSDALAWCVRLCERNESEWIDRLRDATAEVAKIRSEGPA